MNKDRMTHNTNALEGSGNVYQDLGFPDSEDMFVKGQLISKISEIIKERGLTQEKAAAILGLTQPKVSNILKGRFRGISARRLMNCLTRLGRDIQIVVKPARPARDGRVTVHFS